MNYTFTEEDFDVFTHDSLEKTMSELKNHARIKLENLGEYFSDYLTEMTDDTHFTHVAQHARRKVNPPIDSWVAFSTNKRGYKMLPHFQIGLFKDHAFCQYGIIYEAPSKEYMADRLINQVDDILNLGDGYFITKNHMKPEKMFIKDLKEDDVKKAIERLKTVKSGELMIGKFYDKNDPVLTSDEAFLEELKNVFNTLHTFYVEEESV